MSSNDSSNAQAQYEAARDALIESNYKPFHTAKCLRDALVNQRGSGDSRLPRPCMKHLDDIIRQIAKLKVKFGVDRDALLSRHIKTAKPVRVRRSAAGQSAPVDNVIAAVESASAGKIDKYQKEDVVEAARQRIEARKQARREAEHRRQEQEQRRLQEEAEARQLAEQAEALRIQKDADACRIQEHPDHQACEPQPLMSDDEAASSSQEDMQSRSRLGEDTPLSESAEPGALMVSTPTHEGQPLQLPDTSLAFSSLFSSGASSYSLWSQPTITNQLFSFPALAAFPHAAPGAPAALDSVPLPLPIVPLSTAEQSTALSPRLATNNPDTRLEDFFKHCFGVDYGTHLARFREQEIEYEFLNELRDSELIELGLDKIGLRLKFKKGLKSHCPSV